MSDENRGREQRGCSQQELERELHRERVIRLCLEIFSPYGILFFDEEKVLRSCNPHFVEMMGQPGGEFTGEKSPFSFLTLPDQQKFDELFTVAVKKKQRAIERCELFLHPK